MRLRVIRAAGSRAVGVIAVVWGLCLAGCASGGSGVQGGETRAEARADSTMPSPEQLARDARTLAREEELLGQPLTADAAAEIALLHHPSVDRGLAALGLLEADRLLLAHTVNPEFNNGRLSDTVERRIQRPLSLNVMTWVSVPALAPGLSDEERTLRVQAADLVGAQLLEAQRAWVTAVAARQSVAYLEDVLLAAEVSRDLMASMRRVGNASELDALRGQRFYAEAVGHLAHAQATAAIERERLAQAMGLWGPDAERIQLPDRLPDLPETTIGPEGLEARAVAQRFDLRAARLANTPDEAAIYARGDLRTAWLSYRATHELALHARRAIVPLAEQMSAEQLKRYNGMLIGVFDLIADAAARIDAVNNALAAERSFWLAEVDLQQALIGVGTRSAGAIPSGFAVPSLQHVH